MIASLALNALLIGVIIRGLWIARANFAMAGAAVEASIPAFVNTLPQQRREELRRASLPERPITVLRPLRMELRRARADAARAFLADPFDKQALIAAQERLFEAEDNLRRTAQKLLPELGERLTPAERRAYLNWRGHGGDRRGRWRSERGDGDEPATGPRRN
jgi:uncharacterized membrane protein